MVLTNGQTVHTWFLNILQINYTQGSYVFKCRTCIPLVFTQIIKLKKTYKVIRECIYKKKFHSQKAFSFSSYILGILIYFCLIQIMLFILLSTLHDFIQTPPLCAFASEWISQRVVWVLCTHSLTQWQRQSFFRFTMFLANFIHTRIKGIKEPLEQGR